VADWVEGWEVWVSEGGNLGGRGALYWRLRMVLEKTCKKDGMTPLHSVAKPL
jgi:hypothetical protein